VEEATAVGTRRQSSFPGVVADSSTVVADSSGVAADPSVAVADPSAVVEE
jgi:hypothetical protein